MYCSKCGAEILDEAVICPKCGCYTNNQVAPPQNTTSKPVSQPNNQTSSGLKIATKVFMIIGCVFSGFWLLPLAWTIPMTLNYCQKIKTGEKLSTGFKICSLLFVNLIAGILMLCDEQQ